MTLSKYIYRFGSPIVCIILMKNSGTFSIHRIKFPKLPPSRAIQDNLATVFSMSKLDSRISDLKLAYYTWGPC